MSISYTIAISITRNDFLVVRTIELLAFLDPLPLLLTDRRTQKTSAAFIDGHGNPAFIKLSEVDPVYFDTSYFAVPEEAGERAYALLLETMNDMAYAAIAKATMHQREHTVIIRPVQKGLILHTLYYPNEIHEAKGYAHALSKTLKKQEIELAGQFAKALVKPFRPEQFHDEYSQRVELLVESKSKGTAGPRPEKAPRMAPVVDLMSALKKRASPEPANLRRQPSRASCEKQPDESLPLVAPLNPRLSWRRLAVSHGYRAHFYGESGTATISCRCHTAEK